MPQLPATPRSYFSLDESALETLVDLLDDQARVSRERMSKNERRGERRMAYRRFIEILVEHPGGGAVRTRAYGRNVCAAGLACMVGSYFHRGSSVTLMLPRQDGSSEVVGGRVTGCRHVRGSIHEMSIRFERRIEPLLLMIDKLGRSARTGDTLELSDLRGRLLLVEDSVMDSELFKHQIRLSGIETTVVESYAEALAASAGSMYDMVFTDLHIGGEKDGVDLITHIRERGYSGPIVLVTAEISGVHLSRIKKGDIEATLTKPYQSRDLTDLLIRLHRRVGAFSTADMLYSNVADQPGMHEVLERYVTWAKARAGEIENAVHQKDLAMVRQLALAIKGSATTVGFGTLTEVASEAIRTMDSSMSLEEARPHLRMLGLMCQKLAARKG